MGYVIELIFETVLTLLSVLLNCWYPRHNRSEIFIVQVSDDTKIVELLPYNLKRVRV